MPHRKPCRAFYALLLTALLAGCARARIVPTRHGGAVPSLSEEMLSITPPLRGVPLDEELEYQISWWGIPVGNAVLTTSLTEEKRYSGLVRLDCDRRRHDELRRRRGNHSQRAGVGSNPIRGDPHVGRPAG